jgi:hypothetical protein
MSISLKAEDLYIIPKYKVVIDHEIKFLNDLKFKNQSKSYFDNYLHIRN